MNKNHIKSLEVNNFIKLATNNTKFLCLFATLGMIITIFIVLSIPPKYTVSGLVQITNNVPIMGEHSLSSIFDKAHFADDTSSKSEIEMVYITTPNILVPIISKLNLDIEIKPKVLPIVGNLLYLNPKLTENLATVFPSIKKGYVDEENFVNISKFTVPVTKYKKQYQLKVIDNIHYSILDEGEVIINGITQIESYSLDQKIHIKVDKINANSGAIFYVTKHSVDYMVDYLTKELQITQLGKSSQIFNNNTGIIKISLITEKRMDATNLINLIINTLILNSKSESSANYKKTLSFINSELPKVENKLQNTEKELANFKSQNTITLITAQEKTLLSQLATIESDLANSKLTTESLKYSYGNKHPFILALKEQESNLLEQRNQLKIKLKVFPKQEIELARLQNLVEMNQQLLKTLMERQQELQILTSGEVSDVKILNYASIPYMQQNKHSKAFIFVGALVGIILGWFLILFARIIRKNNNPFMIEEQRQIPNIGVIPYPKLTNTGIPVFNNSLILPIKKNLKVLKRLKLVATKVLLNKSEKIFQFLSLDEKKDTALFIPINLGIMFSNLNYKTLLIMVGSQTQIKTLNQNNSQRFAVQPNLSIHCIDQNKSHLLVYNDVKDVVTKESHLFDYIFIHYSDVLMDTTHLINLTFTNKCFMIISPKQTIKKLNTVVELLQQNNMTIDGVIYTYNKPYWIHDNHSK